MRDLAREFFERDLDDAEWRELGRQLEAEDAVKDRFLQSATSYYQALGLPEPSLSPWNAWGGGLGGWSGLALGIVLGAAGGAMAVWALRPEPVPLVAPAVVEPAPPPAPAAAPPARTAPRPEPGPTLAPPPDKAAPAREASPGFPGLAAVVELSRQGLVTARVLDAQGQEQRLLFAGMLDAGRWSFGWDGQDEVARPVQPGTYTIEVQEGRRVLRRSVIVQAKDAGGAR